MISMGNPVVAADGGFTPPGPGDFNLPPIGGGHETFDFLGRATTSASPSRCCSWCSPPCWSSRFFYVAARKRAMVPGRLQFVGEEAYGFVRNSVGRDIIGSHDFMRFVPYLFTLFFFILINNLFATIPFIQFPTLSRAGMVYGLAVMSWVVYNARRHPEARVRRLPQAPVGARGHQRARSCSLLVPLEFLSNILVRPVTLALRLFANMLAGHLLLILFALGGEYLILHMGIAYAAGRHPRLGRCSSPSHSWSCWSSSCRRTSSCS